MTRRLVTGATGFIGGAITLELLARTDDELVCLVRADSDESAADRLRTELGAMAVGYGRPDLRAAVERRVRPLRGDITLPGCGVDRVPRVDEVWHCAASLDYKENQRAQIEAQNVAGTANMLALARRSGAGTVNHVSTAYVAGSVEGTVLEAPNAGVEVCNNIYEQTKVRGESLVLQATDLRVRVLRPSIVIGHSLTRHAINHSGVYGFARQVLLFRRSVQRRLGTFLSHSRVRLLAHPHAEVNVIPIDHVARNAVTIGLSSSGRTFFHLTNGAAPTVGWAGSIVLGLIGLREPLWVNDKDGFTALDEALDKNMDFYRSYLCNGKQFDRTNVDAVCGTEASLAPLSEADLTESLLPYLHSQPEFARDQPERLLHQTT